MASVDKKNREIRKKIQDYLKAPSGEAAAGLKGPGFVSVLSGMWPKLSRTRKKAAIELLGQDASEEALQLLRRVALDPREDVEIRLNASDILGERGAVPAGGSPGSLLREMVRAAGEDDGRLARELVARLGGDELEAFADLLAEKRAANALAACGKEASGRSSEKIIRRAAHRLRSQGLEVPDWEERGRPVLKPLRKDEPLAFATIPDGEGKQVVFICLPLESGLVHLGQGILDENKGLEEYNGSESTRSGAKAVLKSIRSQEKIKLFEIPFGHASRLLEEAARIASRNNSAISRDYAGIRTLIAEYADSYRPPEPESLIDGEVTLNDAREAVGLLDHYTMQSWAPDPVSVKLCRQKLEVALTSTLVISESQRMEQVEKALHDSARSYLESEEGRNFIERLKRAARLLAGNGETALARQAVAAARQLESAEGVPYLAVEMFRKIFPDIAEAMKQARGEEESGGFVEKREESGGGGIIIP